MGNVLDIARKHTKQILSGGGFETYITFQTPPGQTSVTATIKGLAISHHTSIDDDGVPVRSMHVHITVSEASLTDESYPVRNSEQKVVLKNHKVSWKDSTGITKTYIIEDVLPDNTLGMIPLILGNLG